MGSGSEGRGGLGEVDVFPAQWREVLEQFRVQGQVLFWRVGGASESSADLA